MDVEDVLEEVLKAVDHAFKVGLEYIPNIEKFVIDILDTMFAPKQIARQIAMISALQVLVVFYQGLGTIGKTLHMKFTDKGRKEKELLDNLADATSFSDWQKVAYKLDEHRGFDQWRNIDDSTLYDAKTLTKRISGTSEMLDRGDVFNLMFRLRGGLARDQFGMQHAGLFTRAMAGTKHIVEKYHETMANALNFVCDSPIADEEVTDFLKT
jgi:TAG lipase/steryl ester hydrolase/phospholipase A2/LPA acyltransferase